MERKFKKGDTVYHKLDYDKETPMLVVKTEWRNGFWGRERYDGDIRCRYKDMAGDWTWDVFNEEELILKDENA